MIDVISHALIYLCVMIAVISNARASFEQFAAKKLYIFYPICIISILEPSDFEHTTVIL